MQSGHNRTRKRKFGSCVEVCSLGARDFEWLLLLLRTYETSRLQFGCLYGTMMFTMNASCPGILQAFQRKQVSEVRVCSKFGVRSLVPAPTQLRLQD